MSQCKDGVLRGRIHSFQSLGTVDGPSVRSVIFMQGCPLRCICCHNPDTWDFAGGEEHSSSELVERVLRYKRYYGSEGGVTVSGGEPLMQAAFLCELFRKLKAAGISTCLDTSGCVLNDDVKELLEVTDIVLLDYKYTNATDYLKYTRLEESRVREFLDHLESVGKRTWLRYVLIPGINDTDSAVERLFAIKKAYSCVEKVELLPFRKLCLEKYESMGLDFPLKDTPEASSERVDELYASFDK